MAALSPLLRYISLALSRIVEHEVISYDGYFSKIPYLR